MNIKTLIDASVPSTSSLYFNTEEGNHCVRFLDLMQCYQTKYTGEKKIIKFSLEKTVECSEYTFAFVLYNNDIEEFQIWTPTHRGAILGIQAIAPHLQTKDVTIIINKIGGKRHYSFIQDKKDTELAPAVSEKFVRMYKGLDQLFVTDGKVFNND
jgi:hypothetical protein